MRTSDQRRDMYEAKVNPATVGLKVAARLEKMKVDFEAFTNQKCLDEAGTIAVLNEDAIPRIRWGMYFGYSSELTRLTRMTEVSGTLAVNEAQGLTDKWIGYGATCTTLAKIALNVFNITVVCAS